MSDSLDALVDQKKNPQQEHFQKHVQWIKYELKRFHAGEVPSLSEGSPEWAELRNFHSWETLCQRLESSVQGRFFVGIGRSLH